MPVKALNSGSRCNVESSVAEKSQLLLLYVEDEPTTRDVVCTLLRRRFPDIRIYTAENGKEGLERFRELRPDIVVTDIKMPVMNGIEMTRAIKILNGTVSIIVTSAHSDMDYFIDSIEIGITSYVMKPIVKDKLITAIENCVASIMLERRVKEQAEELEAANIELEKANRELEAVNQELEAFNYTVSHDLRGPLTNISGSCQVLNELYGNKLDEQGKQFIQYIHDGILCMDSLIDALLKFSRQSHQELQRIEVDLSSMAMDISADLRIRQPERRNIFTIAKSITCIGDPLLLRSVMENLLGNAWKYTSKRKSARIEFGVTEVEGKPAYFVRDNGIGFDMGESHRLFVTFQRLHDESEFEGIGIGLATVQRIIQRHGGKVWAEGKIGKGAVFYFTLRKNLVSS
jgi:signal transduction histidine kinase